MSCIYHGFSTREAPPPAAAGQTAEEEAMSRPSTAHSADAGPSRPRGSSSPKRGMVNMQSLMSSTVFKHYPPPPPVPTSTAAQSYTAGGRKLRKSRSRVNILSSAKSRSKDARVVAAAAPAIYNEASTSTLPTRHRDPMASVMNWGSSDNNASESPPVSAVSSRSSHSLTLAEDLASNGGPRSGKYLEQPFGPSISFDVPTTKTPLELLRTPHGLREVQSFESGLTARATDSPNNATRTVNKPHPSPSPLADDSIDWIGVDPGDSTANGADDATDDQDQGQASKEPPSPILKPLYPTIFPTGTIIFDALHSLRPLPPMDLVLRKKKALKMSTSDATPGDDPRFVIWGEKSEFDLPGDKSAVAQTSADDGMSSSAHSSYASRWQSSHTSETSTTSVGEAKPPAVAISSASQGSDDDDDAPAPRILLAATAWRWLAQLTSGYDYDEIIVFLLVYRRFFNGVDLLHLFIARFYWALEKPKSLQDQLAKATVRVRTFGALRTWLGTFFHTDFLPDHELRLLLQNWINTMLRDPLVRRHRDVLVSDMLMTWFLGD